MRYLGIATMAFLVVMATAGAAQAGFFHTGDTLNCPDCHTMHFSQQHDYTTAGTTNFIPLGAGGPFEHLLRNEVNDLCLSCHDGQTFAPDVFELNTNSNTRQAGALGIVGGDAQYPPPTGHTLNSTDTAPGGTFANTNGLECTDCHAAHGGGLATADPYRNLGGFGTAVGSSTQVTFARASAGPNDLTLDVFVQDGGAIQDKYDIANVWFNEPDTANSGMATLCKGCHTDFHGTIGGAEIGGAGSPPEGFLRHPNAGVNIGDVGGGHSSITVFTGHAPNQVKVMDPLGQTGNWTDAANKTLTPTCISCHKGHGNQNAFGLIFMKGSDKGGGTVTEQGDGGTGVRDLCKQCHVQGG